MITRGVAFLFSLTFATLVLAAEYRCPDKIETKQALMVQLEGWESMVDTLNGFQTFEYLAVFSGHPSGGAMLRPDEDKKKNAFWHGDPTRGLWVACRYQQSTIRIFREIGKEAKKCTLKGTTVRGASKKVLNTLICE